MDPIYSTPTDPQPDRSISIKRPPPASIRELECKLRDAKKQYKKHLEAGGCDTDFVLNETVVTIPKTRTPTLVMRLMTTLTCRSVASFLMGRYGAAALHKMLTMARSPNPMRRDDARNLSVLVKRPKNAARDEHPVIPHVEQPKALASALAICLYREVNLSCATEEDIESILNLDVTSHPERVLTIPAYARALAAWTIDPGTATSTGMGAEKEEEEKGEGSEEGDDDGSEEEGSE
jgi:hypothetical protein